MKTHTLKPGDIIFWDTQPSGTMTWMLLTPSGAMLKRGTIADGLLVESPR